MTGSTQEETDAGRAPGSFDVDGEPERPHDVDQSPVGPSGVRAALFNVAGPLVVLLAALGIGLALISSPPDVPKSDPATLAPVVGVADLVPHDTTVFVDAFGTVVPSRELRILPEVSGRIVELNDELEPGGLIVSGALLFRIDPADYEIALAQAEADLDVARHEASRIRARIETLRRRGQQLDVEIDYLEWNLDRLTRLAELDHAAQFEARDAVKQLDSEKVARLSLDAEIVEQVIAVESAGASVRVAERRVEAAKLALGRTELTAPFDAIVISESLEVGQLVGPQTAVAELAATGEFWAEAAIPVARLRDVRFAAENEGNASRVSVSLATDDDMGVREGLALRPLGNLDPLGRMAQVLISIRDPLGVDDHNGGAGRRLLLGSYVRLRIESGTLHDVYSIPRKALRENNRVWVRGADGRLAIRPIEIVWRRHEDVLVRNGFQPGDELVTTHLASVVPGMPLRVRNEPAVPVDGTLDTDGAAERVSAGAGSGDKSASAKP